MSSCLECYSGSFPAFTASGANRYLAAALRESSSVEGQGATIQDRVGYAIQTLLKMVREDLGLGKDAPMPQELASRFADEGALEVVRPLWASG
jgi:hypothetical protein